MLVAALQQSCGWRIRVQARKISVERGEGSEGRNPDLTQTQGFSPPQMMRRNEFKAVEIKAEMDGWLIAAGILET